MVGVRLEQGQAGCHNSPGAPSRLPGFTAIGLSLVILKWGTERWLQNP